MNIFVLDTNSVKSSLYHDDNHIVKMSLKTFIKFNIFIKKEKYGNL